MTNPVPATPEKPAPPAPGLHGSVVSGLRWKAVSQGVALGSRTVVGIVLAHLLTPPEFGLAALALVFTGFAGIFTDLSMGAALIQRATITEADRSTAFWTTLGSGVVMTGIGLAFAPFASSFFATPHVGAMFAATASLAFLSSISLTQTALLSRAMNFRSLELRAVGSSLVGGAAAIAMAFEGFGAWAIIGQALIAACVDAALVWRLSSWRPTRTYSRASLRLLGSFGVKTLLSRILSYLNLFADNLLIGRYLGSAALGVYAIAYNVMFQPMTTLVAPIQQVMYPALVRLQHDRVRQGQAWLRANKVAAAITVPAFLGIAVIAPDFVPVVLGARWHRSVPVLQLLSLAGVAQGFQTLNWTVIQAKGKPGVVLKIMLFTSAVTLSAFVLGLEWGVVGVAGLFAVARAIALVLNTTVTCRTLEFPLLSYLRGMSIVGILSLAMAVTVFLSRLVLVDVGLAQGARLPVLVLIGIASYGLLVKWRASNLIGEFRALMMRR